jgi:uncharacterized cupin superfamily protein
VKKIDLDTAPTRIGTAYPPPFDAPCLERERRKLGDAAGLTQFGVNLLRLPPGAWSSQRHWHTAEDEFVWVVEGEVVLVTGAGEEVLRAGDCAGFRAGDPDGHHLQNRSDKEAVLLEVGGRRPGEDAVDYPDIDLTLAAGSGAYQRRDGGYYGTPGRKR